jgi:hypothetical protein
MRRTHVHHTSHAPLDQDTAERGDLLSPGTTYERIDRLLPRAFRRVASTRRRVGATVCAARLIDWQTPTLGARQRRDQREAVIVRDDLFAGARLTPPGQHTAQRLPR